MNQLASTPAHISPQQMERTKLLHLHFKKKKKKTPDRCWEAGVFSLRLRAQISAGQMKDAAFSKQPRTRSDKAGGGILSRVLAASQPFRGLETRSHFRDGEVLFRDAIDIATSDKPTRPTMQTNLDFPTYIPCSSPHSLRYCTANLPSAISHSPRLTP